MGIHLCDRAVVDGRACSDHSQRMCSLRAPTDVPSCAASAAVHISLFSLRGPFAQRLTKSNFFLFLMKYEHVADVDVKFYNCATYVQSIII